MIGSHDPTCALKWGQQPLHDPAMLTIAASRQKFCGCDRVHPEEEFSADSGQDKPERPVAEVINPDRGVEEEIQRMGL